MPIVDDVPIYPVPGADPQAERKWTLVLQSDATDEELRVISQEFADRLQTHPGTGEVPLWITNRPLLLRPHGRGRGWRQQGLR